MEGAWKSRSVVAASPLGGQWRSFPPVTREPTTLPPRNEGTDPRPVAVAVLEDGSLLVLDTTRPRLQRMT